MSLSSDEINLLIQHYLQEFGYNHSAFAFGAESKIPTRQMANRYVPPGSLIYLVQKGMMLSQIEKHAEDSVNFSPNGITNEVTSIIDSLHQSMEMNHDALENTRKLRLSNPDSESNKSVDSHLIYQLNPQCSLFLEGHKKPVVFAEWDQKSEILATASLDGNAIVWTLNYNTSEHISYVLDDPAVYRPCVSMHSNDDVTSLAWSNFDGVLATGTFSGLIVLYKDKSEVHRLSHTAPIVSLHFAPESSLLASVSTDGHIIVSENGEIKGTWDVEPPVSDIQFLNMNFAYVSSNNSVFLITLTEKSPVKVAEMKGEIIQIALSPKSHCLAIGDNKGNFTVLNHKQTVVYNHDHLHDSSICSISPAVNSDSFATGGCDGFVKLVNIEQKNKDVVFDGHAKASYLVAYDPLDRYIASTGPDKILSIWNISTNQIMYRFFVNEPITYMTWSPNGKFLSVCLYSSQVSLIDFDNIDQ